MTVLFLSRWVTTQSSFSRMACMHIYLKLKQMLWLDSRSDFDCTCISPLIGKLRSTVRFRVPVPVPVQYGGMTILKKVGSGYGGDICFIKFFYILLCIYFLYIDKHM